MGFAIHSITFRTLITIWGDESSPHLPGEPGDLGYLPIVLCSILDPCSLYTGYEESELVRFDTQTYSRARNLVAIQLLDGDGKRQISHECWGTQY